MGMQPFYADRAGLYRWWSSDPPQPLRGGRPGAPRLYGCVFDPEVALHKNSLLHRNYKVCTKITIGYKVRVAKGRGLTASALL